MEWNDWVIMGCGILATVGIFSLVIALDKLTTMRINLTYEQGLALIKEWLSRDDIIRVEYDREEGEKHDQTAL